jgi:predicted metal-dependent enzyme (double-stranded beta helix superfamily)
MSDLTIPELRDVVSALATQPERWRQFVRHDPGQRHYEELLRDEHLSVWLINWTDEQDTGFHDHDVSSGAVTVVQGRIVEERLRVGAEPSRAEFGPGETFDFAAEQIHRVVHAGDEPAVTLHAYSPPLWRMGAYLVEPDGTLQRFSVSYAEELRPLDAQLAA